jgi:hypothetical protein
MIHGTTELNTWKGVENYLNEAWVVEMNLEFQNHLGHMEQIYFAQLSCSLPAIKEKETMHTIHKLSFRWFQYHVSMEQVLILHNKYDMNWTFQH